MKQWLQEGRWLDRFTRRMAFIGFVGLVVVSVVILADVLLRWLFNAPLDGLEEITQYTIAIVVASGLPAGLVQGHNVTIRFLGRAVGRRGSLWLESFGALVTLLFFAIIGWKLFEFALEEMLNDRFTLTLEMPTAPWWWAIWAVVLICVPVQIAVLLARGRAALTGEEPDMTAPDAKEGGV